MCEDKYFVHERNFYNISLLTGMNYTEPHIQTLVLLHTFLKLYKGIA